MVIKSLGALVTAPPPDPFASATTWFADHSLVAVGVVVGVVFVVLKIAGKSKAAWGVVGAGLVAFLFIGAPALMQALTIDVVKSATGK